ncbi:unnamed protein product [marine sediment metagenome]|uniref:Uncharacterized protein n=1 Tax=marine sediment metagenome TaxID=412755 RepID=X0YZ38_9ZZZZ
MSDTLYESYASGEDSIASIYSTVYWVQTFQSSTAHTVTSVKFKLYRIGSPGSITIDIKAVDGDGKPTGTSMATGSYDCDAITTDTDGELIEITLSYGAALTADTEYAIICMALSATGANVIRARMDSSSPTYSNGNVVFSNTSGASWSVYNNQDLIFYEYGTVPTHNIVTSEPTLGLSTTSTNTVIVSATNYTRGSGPSLGMAASASMALAIARSSAASMSLVPSTIKEEDLGSYLCVASRDVGSIKTANSLGGTWTDCAKEAAGGLAGAYFAQYLNRLCVVNNQNSGFSYSSANDITANWTEKVSFPNYP